MWQYFRVWIGVVFSYTFKALGAGFYGLQHGSDFRATLRKLIMQAGDADRSVPSLPPSLPRSLSPSLPPSFPPASSPHSIYKHLTAVMEQCMGL